MRLSLATAHAVLMFLALAALALLAYSWPTAGSPATAAWLQAPALALQGATLLYLSSTAVIELQISQALRQGKPVSALLQLPTLLGHLWVLLVAAAAAWRHTDSRTYLSGLDWQLSVLLSASLLALLLLALTRRLTRPAGIAGEAAYPLRSQHRGLAWLHAVLSLLVVFALWYLETRPLTPPID